jgi:hypothetical protein
VFNTRRTGWGGNRDKVLARNLQGKKLLEDLGRDGKMSKQISGIIGRTALSEPQPSLEDSARFVCVRTSRFHFFKFRNNNFLQSKFVSLTSNTQPGRFMSPQRQGDTVVSPGRGFPFRCLLRLAGLRWRYSSPPPHRIIRPDFKSIKRQGVYLIRVNKNRSKLRVFVNMDTSFRFYKNKDFEAYV